MSYTSTGGLPTIPRLAVAGVDEGAPNKAVFSGTATSLTSLTLPAQASAPAAPASGVVLYANSSGKLSWRRASDGYTRTFEVTATANRTFTIPDASFTFAGQNLANTFTLANTFQAQTTIPLGNAASPAINFTGTSSGLFSSGGGLANISINGTERFRFAASTLTIANTAGEYSANFDTFLSRKGAANWQLGTADVAAPVAQTLSVQSVVAGTSNTAGANFTIKGSAGTGTGAGGSLIFQVTQAGSSGSSQNAYVTALTVSSNNSLTATFGGSLLCNSTSAIGWSGARTLMRAPVDGQITLLNNAETDFSRLQFGGITSSFPALKRATTTLQAVLADDSGFAATQSLYDRFGSGTPEGAVTAPVGAVYHRTDGGAGTSFYVKESGSGNTGWVAK